MEAQTQHVPQQQGSVHSCLQGLDVSLATNDVTLCSPLADKQNAVMLAAQHFVWQLQEG